MDSYSVSYNAADDQNSSYTSSPTLNVRILVVAGIIVVLVVLLVIAMHLYVRRIWADFGWVAGDRMADVQHPERMQDAPVGLDKGVLDALPTFVYTKESTKEPMECSVCISEFRENETGRLLPKCNHCFHTACIDMWFLSHSTCPLCRATVGEESISHKDAENLRVDEEIGVQAAPSHVASVELTFDPNYRTMAEEQISNDVLKNAFEKQATYSEQQQQEYPHSNSHNNLEKDPSVQYPLNTLFYGNQNHGNLRSSSKAERFKKLEHLVIEVPSRPTIYPSNCASRPTSPTPTPTSGHEFGSPLSHLKTIKRIFSMREKRSSVPAIATPKSINHFHGQAILTP